MSLPPPPPPPMGGSLPPPPLSSSTLPPPPSTSTLPPPIPSSLLPPPNPSSLPPPPMSGSLPPAPPPNSLPPPPVGAVNLPPPPSTGSFLPPPSVNSPPSASLAPPAGPASGTDPNLPPPPPEIDLPPPPPLNFDGDDASFHAAAAAKSAGLSLDRIAENKRKAALRETESQNPLESAPMKALNLSPFAPSMWPKPSPPMAGAGSGAEIPVAVYLMNDKGMWLYIKEDATGEALRLMIIKQLDLKMHQYFALCHRTSDGDQWLDPVKRLNQQVPPVRERSVIFLKIRYMCDIPNIFRDLVALRLLYYQVKNDVIHGRVPLPANVFVRLAALQLQIEYGGHSPAIHKQGFFETSDEFAFSDFVPSAFQSLLEKSGWEDRIFALHASLKLSVAAAQLAYVEAISRTLHFGITEFVGMTTGKTPQKAKLGVTSSGLLVTIGATTIPAYYDFTKLGQWKVTPEGILIPMKGAPYTFKLKTLHAQQLCHLLIVYQLYYVVNTLSHFPSMPPPLLKILPHHSLFKPIRKRMPFDPERSRLAVFHRLYVESQSTTKVFHPAFSQYLLECLDSLHETWSSFNPAIFSLERKEFEHIYVCLQKAYEYVPKKHHHFYENIGLTKVILDNSLKLFPKTMPTLVSFLRLTSPRQADGSVLPSQLLSLANCKLGASDITVLASLFTKDPAVPDSAQYCVESIDLSSNELGGKGGQAILYPLRMNSTVIKTLKSLNFCNCAMDETPCNALSGIMSLPDNNLKSLSLAGNKFAQQGIRDLSKGFESFHCQLERLNLGYVQLTSEGLQSLLMAITLTKTLKVLYLNNCAIASKAILPLNDFLIQPECKLEDLNLANNGFNKATCKELCTCLKNNKSLVSINLSGNHFDVESAEALEDSLRFNPTITTLKLNKVDLDAKGGLVLSQLIATKKRLIHVELNENWKGKATREVFSTLCPAIGESASIESVSLCGNDIAEEASKFIASMMRTSRVLKDLYLDANKLGDKGMFEICTAIPVAHCLSTLSLAENQITSAGAKYIVGALSRRGNAANKVHLNLSRNSLPKETRDTLQDELKAIKLII